MSFDEYLEDNEKLEVCAFLILICLIWKMEIRFLQECHEGFNMVTLFFVWSYLEELMVDNSPLGIFMFVAGKY